MTTKEKAADIVLLARVVMGWEEVKTWTEYHAPNPTRVIRFFANSNNNVVAVDGREWDPRTNIAGAMEMLDRFLCWQLCRTVQGSHICRVGSTLAGLTNFSVCPTILDAICDACLEWARAQGEK